MRQDAALLRARLGEQFRLGLQQRLRWAQEREEALDTSGLVAAHDRDAFERMREAANDKRDRNADERDRVADDREAAADKREAAADERDRVADQREGAAEERPR